MTILSPRRRRAARTAALAGAVLSACMLALSLWTAIAPGTPVATAAATNAGAATITPTSGTHSTSYTLRIDASAACTGDSASGNYKVNGYMVPAATDPGSISFTNSGPVGGLPLISATGSQKPFLNALTDIATTPGGPGQISQIPNPFSFSQIPKASIPNGVYNIGILCNKGPNSAVDKYWNAQITIADDPADANGIAWTVTAGGTTTTTTGASTTTTTAGGTTTTTAAGGSTTTTLTSGSSTTLGSGSTTTLTGGVSGSDVTGGTPSGASFVTPSGVLPYTGGSPWNLVLWGVLLLVFGRMAILLGRTPRVRRG